MVVVFDVSRSKGQWCHCWSEVEGGTGPICNAGSACWLRLVVDQETQHPLYAQVKAKVWHLMAAQSPSTVPLSSGTFM